VGLGHPAARNLLSSSLLSMAWSRDVHREKVTITIDGDAIFHNRDQGPFPDHHHADQRPASDGGDHPTANLPLPCPGPRWRLAW
jgi:hypothetical protein